ncbi:hypothetical protein EV401DRAFT_1908657 [Pisolithus croceorrhizus]|nr:hypothetical protein EV401DRAFT_1908657 [Pisolithus croceorrhizus]
MVDILVMFGLDYLQKLVGKITFLERLPSIMQAWRCGEPSVVAADGNGSPTYLSSPMSVDWETWPEYVDLLWTWKGPRHETDMAYGVSWVRQDGEYSLIKKEAKQHEIGFISDSLSASLLKLIYVACDNVGKEDDEEDWEDDEEEREDDEEEWEYDEEEWEANKLRYQGGHTDFDMVGNVLSRLTA